MDRFDLTGTVVTADALHTQRAHARYLHRHRAKYLFIVKRNQPNLHDQLAGLRWDHVPVGDHTQDKGHGRRKSRTLQVTSVAAGIGFPHAKLAARLTRARTTSDGKRSTEVVYAITSLDWPEVTPAQLAALIRGHWAIENRVHWVRDVVFDEDRSQLRTGNGPRVIATLRNLTIGLTRTLDPRVSIAATTRDLAYRVDLLIDMLDPPSVSLV